MRCAERTPVPNGIIDSSKSKANPQDRETSFFRTRFQRICIDVLCLDRENEDNYDVSELILLMSDRAMLVNRFRGLYLRVEMRQEQ